MDALTRVLEVEPFEAMIVFVRTKQATEEVAEKLRARGFSAAAINGDIPQAQRERTIAALKRRAASTSWSPPMWRRGAWTSSGSRTCSTTTSRTTPSPTCTASGAPGGPGVRAARCCSFRPAGTPPAEGDRKGHAANAHRGRVAHRRGRQRAAGGEVRRFHHRRARRSGHRAVPQAGRGLRTRARRPDGRHCRGAGVAVARRRGSS